jgi:hypothetical protein
MRKSFSFIRRSMTPKNFALAATAVLLAVFWMITLPLARAREMSPTEMLQSNLPKPKTLANATKGELLAAICATIQQHPGETAQIVRVAIAARRPSAAEIIGRAIHCSRGDQNCNLVGELVSAAISADPDDAAAIIDSAAAAAPDCHAAIEQGSRANGGAGANPNQVAGFGNAPENQSLPAGTTAVGGGGFNPQNNNCTVCENGREISIPCAQTTKYIAGHPGDTLGACQVTSAANR